MKTYLKDLTPEEIIKRLKNGESVKVDCYDCEDRIIYIKMIDGIICRFFDDGDIMIGTGFGIENCYFETEEHFEIKETGLYVTRDGIEAYISKIDKDYVYGVINNNNLMNIWHKNGMLDLGEENDLDIISKWEV